MLVSFPLTVVKHPNENTSQEEELTLAHSSKAQSVTAEKSRQFEA